MTGDVAPTKGTGEARAQSRLPPNAWQGLSREASSSPSSETGLRHFGVENNSMATRLTSKGQIVIPTAFRRELGMRPGTPIQVKLE